MNQPTFADLEYEGKKRKTRREVFLERMDSLIPWGQLEERIRPFYPKAGRGRRPYELSAMVRIHCVQLFYNLSDPGMEDMLYEVESVRRFVGLRLSGPLPDETTILNFRHLLEEHELGQGLFEKINRHLESQGLRLREGTIVDASIIEAPSSTKNRAGDRDPEMRQTKKGNEWHFGMKVHIGADAETGVVHSVTTTPANVHDVTEAHRLLHGGEKRVWGDAGYQGVDKRAENRELGVEWQVAMRPGRRRQLEPGSYEALAEKRKASVRAKVEHPFLYVKRHFGYAKVRYRHDESGTETTLTHERTFRRTGSPRSVSFPQRPDIVLEVRAPDSVPRLFVFDPKYKLDSEGHDEESLTGRPHKTDIDKMHAGGRVVGRHQRHRGDVAHRPAQPGTAHE